MDLVRSYFGSMNDNVISCTQSLSIGYKQNRRKFYSVQQNLNLSMKRGEMICLIGPNGCGKSTLIRSIAGLQHILSGEIYIEGRAVSTLNNKEKAKLMSLVLTDRVEAGNLSVFDIVSIGRQPYTSWLGDLSENDKQMIWNALEQVHLLEYADRYLYELSDGEKQRVMIAKALVQDTSLIILDEPTAHLDLPNRVEIMLLLRNLAKQTKKTIILSTHELDLALQTADVIWLMQQNKGVSIGVPEDLVLNGSFQQIFANNSFSFDEFTGNFNLNYESKVGVTLQGDKKYCYWTTRALLREGYFVVSDSKLIIEVEKDHIWKLILEGNEFIFNDIAGLLHQLNELRSSKI